MELNSAIQMNLVTIYTYINIRIHISSYEQFSNWSQSPEANKSYARRRRRRRATAVF